jgi:methylmalonyl-CoA/ethylmalonyl-CoA epimerase
LAKKTPAKSTFSNLWDIGVVVRDIDKTAKRLESLGMGPFIQPRPPAGDEGLFFHGKPLVSNFKALITKIGNIEFNLLQPDDKPSPWKDFLDTKGEGIHHLGFQVDDVEKEVNRLTSQGAEVILIGRIRGKMGAAYLDLKIGNILIELTSFGSVMK